LLWQDALPQRVEGTRSARVVLPPAAGKISRPDFLPGAFFLRNFSAPSMGDRGRDGPALYRAAEAAPALRPTEFPEVACPSSCATALATRDPGRNRSNTTLDRDQSRIGADVRAVRPHNLLPNCLDRCSFCAPCLSSCQQIRAARLRHPCCGQATVAAAKKKPHSTRGPGTKGNSRCSYRSHLRQLGAALL